MDKQNNKLSLEDLKGKQSVRATFRLPQQVIDLLSVIAAQLGIKQKSLFDQLVENPTVLKKIADDAEDYDAVTGERVQKTYVISRSTLTALDRVAGNRKIPRDILVEISINRLLPIIEAELEKHEKRKVLLKDLQTYLKQGKQLRKKTQNLLGTEDQVYEMIDQQVRICERNVALIEDIVEKGKPMEHW
ncbi:MAG: hypothetical protein SCH71_11680 [Desulfobulbaceae bacterium]|nr:hypothetical protein [Desulfobulbaceae bacterium]